MGAAEALLILAVGFLFCAAVAGFLGFIFWSLMKGNQQISAGAQAIKAGRVPDLLPWTSPASLSADWVGATIFTRGIGGKRDQASGFAQTAAQAGTVFAFQLDARNGWRDGRLELAGPFRVVLEVRQGLATVTRDGARLGTVSLDSGDLTGSGGNVIGKLVRDAVKAGLDAGPGRRSALVLGNTPVALVDAHTQCHQKRPARLRPLLLRYEPNGPDAEAWTVVACLVVMGWWGVATSHAGISDPSLGD